MEISEKKIEICEVGPRDGLQNLKRKFSIDERVDFINRLIECGLTRIETGSFINPKKVPNMDYFEKVLDRIDRVKDVSISGLVLNEKGVLRALAHGGIDELRYVLVASETFSKFNQGASIKQNLQMLAKAAPDIKKANKKLTVVIAAAFGCPYEGIIHPKRVEFLVRKSMQYNADEILLADTIGVGVPKQVEYFSNRLKSILKNGIFGFHFHNTRNTGYANAITAVNSGATILDSAAGGIGGCPFVPRATGNIATEDLIYLLSNSDCQLNIEKEKLLTTVGWLKELIPTSITGQLHESGYFTNT